MSQVVRRVGGVFLPTTCAGCGQVGGVLCDTCRAQLNPAPRLDPPPGVDVAIALVAYEGVAAAAIRAAKFHQRRGALVPFADALGRLVARQLIADTVDRAGAVVTWVPALSSHRHRRGFDQGAVIARRVAAACGMPTRVLLRRGDSFAQLGLDRATRLAGPRLVARGVAPATVVVVDDVRTTGASLRVATNALRGAGATLVIAATIAATPHHVVANGVYHPVHI